MTRLAQIEAHVERSGGIWSPYSCGRRDRVELVARRDNPYATSAAGAHEEWDRGWLYEEALTWGTRFGPGVRQKGASR